MSWGHQRRNKIGTPWVCNPWHLWRYAKISNWLVVDLPLWKIWKSDGIRDDYSQYMDNKHGSLNVPIEHHPTIRYMVYNGYYKVISNIPKMGQLPTPDKNVLKHQRAKYLWCLQCHTLLHCYILKSPYFLSATWNRHPLRANFQKQSVQQKMLQAIPAVWLVGGFNPSEKH